MSPLLALGTSVILQLAACAVGLRQLLLSRRSWLWLLITLAFAMVALGRSLTLYQWANDELTEALNPVAEFGALAISAAILTALVVITRRTAAAERLNADVDPHTLKAAFGAARLGLWVWDAKTNLILCSPELRALWGDPQAPASVSTNSFLARVHPDDRDIVRAAIARSIAGGSKYDTEYRIQWANGATHWLADRGEVLRNRTGNPSFMYAVAHDITARKVAELGTVDQEQRLSLAVGAARLGVWDWDVATNKIYFSPQWKFNLGYARHEIGELFSEWESRMHPQDREETMATIGRFVRENAPVLELRQRLLHQDGHYRQFLVRGTAVRDEAERALRIVGCHLDLDETHTEQTPTATASMPPEQEPRPAEADETLLRLALAAYPDAAAIADQKGTLIQVNQPFEQLLEISQRMAAGQSVMKLGRFTELESGQPINDVVQYILQSGAERNAETHFMFLRRSGRTTKLGATVRTVTGTSGDTTYALLLLREVAERVETERTSGNLFSQDSGTGLADRAAFERRLERLLANVEPYFPQAMLHIDLDDFGEINDRNGRIAGDAVLRQVARLLQERLRTRDTLARLGGDKFGVLFEHCPPEEALRIAEQLRIAIQDTPFVWQGNTLAVRASIGMLPLPDGKQSCMEVLSSAEQACNIAKQQGKNQVYVFAAEVDDSDPPMRDLQWLPRIQQALTENRFRLYIQPIRAVNSGSDAYEYGEVLLRMLDADGKIVAPTAFIAAAERYEQMMAIDRWVLQRTLAALRTETQNKLGVDIVAINISGQSLGNREFHHFVTQQLIANSISPRKLCFEITETAAISNMACAIEFMAKLKQQGCRFALDDFGSGFSSFGYLKKLPVDYLKIDGHFVRDMGTDTIDEAMVTAMHNMGQTLGIRTIAESVENSETLSKLAMIGVNYAQGNFIEAPIPLSGANTSNGKATPGVILS